MTFLDRAGRWLAAPVLCMLVSAVPGEAGFRLDPDPAWRHATDMGTLVTVLEDWLDREAPWERRDQSPEILLIQPERAAGLSGLAGRGHGGTRGLYDPDSGTVYLVEPWDAGDAEDVSVLLHELVHHRQAVHHWYCPGAQEEAAYRLQERWLGERGLEADVNWIAVVLEAGCTPKDIHPE